MANLTYIWFLCLLLSFLGNAGLHPLMASHHVNKDVLPSVTDAEFQPYRTAFHFQPPKNWMNGTDPNAPMVYMGIYHLFYQYNPDGPDWGNISWGHATSTDLINWSHQPLALVPSEPSDINGCWSGSATITQYGYPLILYTGCDAQKTQVQNLASPSNLTDPYLIEWDKNPNNPVISPATDNINGSAFRDPSSGWLTPDKQWRVLVGSKSDRRGMALLYRSSDFVNWVKAEKPFFSSENTGMWECPDFFPTDFPYEDSKFVLKVSLDDCKRDYYAIGSYGGPEDDVFIPDEGSLGFGDENTVCSSRLLMFDYGKYYASKSFLIAGYTPESRRILFGWVNESTDASIYTGAGWAGLQAIPRQVWLGASRKQLVQLPVEEIKQLRENQVSLPSAVLQAGSVAEVPGVMGSQADVELEFGDPMLEKAEELKPEWTADPQELCSQMGASVRGCLGPFGLLVLASQDIQEFTAVFFRIFKNVDKYKVLMCSDQTRSSSNLDYDKTTYGAFLDADPLVEKLSLRCLIDHSIVESFGGGGKVCITSRVYPSTAIHTEAHLYAFNNGTVDIGISSLNAWSMKKANIN